MTVLELRELDREIAEKVMGWRWAVDECECPALNHGRCERPDGIFAMDFTPSTKIAAAWQVVEWLRNRWGQLHLVAGLEWHCFPDDDLTHYGIGSGETPELAICRAALAAVRAQKETTP